VLKECGKPSLQAKENPGSAPVSSLQVSLNTSETRAETPVPSKTQRFLGKSCEPDFVKVDEIEALPPETLFEAVEK
jgi:hypothetical protein